MIVYCFKFTTGPYTFYSDFFGTLEGLYLFLTRAYERGGSIEDMKRVKEIQEWKCTQGERPKFVRSLDVDFERIRGVHATKERRTL